MIQNNISISVKDKIEFNSTELDLLKNECVNIGNVFDLTNTVKKIKININSICLDLHKYIISEGVKLNGANLNGALQGSNSFIEANTTNTIMPIICAHALNDLINAYKCHFIIFFVGLLDILYNLNQCSLQQFIEAKIGAWNDIPSGVLGNYLTSFFNDFDLLCQAIRAYDFDLATSRLNTISANSSVRTGYLLNDLATKLNISKEAQNFIVGLLLISKLAAGGNLYEFTLLAKQQKGF